MQLLKIVAAFAVCVTSYAGAAAGMRWTAPAGWLKEPGNRPMRLETFAVPPAPGDREKAECGIYFFGAGEGGGVEANIERWHGQFRAPGGGMANANVQKWNVHGLKATTIDVSGDYSGMGSPMAAQKTIQHNYRLLGAIVEGPGGNVFIKFTGPTKTVAANRQKFDALLNSFQKTPR
jgi:hypothetical protein